MGNLRLIFTSEGVGVGVGVVIRSVKLYDLVKNSVLILLIPLTSLLRLRRLRSTENWVVGVASRSGTVTRLSDLTFNFYLNS